MSARLEWVEELFHAALERPAEARATFVRSVCENDDSLAEEVASMLRAHAAAEGFLERPALELHAETFAGEEESALPAGTPLGVYRVVSLLGAGGMGEVYLAEDPELGRQVAIKLLKRGFGIGVARHLRQEARILAGLNDPHIARLYGVAATPEGVPYFIMEYVEGERLDDYCERRRLTTNERLELFRKVCAAVSYAHRHLVIHRDIKPANIRVTPDGEPKLLDFGIAKLLRPETAPTGEPTTLMLAGLMTPDYASPEQVRGDDMTTASDVYSLGIVLYQLLTGEHPYRLTSRKPHDIVRTISEQEPARPSLIRRDLAGDLDNILLMALRKEPERRYSSVGQFSEDIWRYLAGLPVAARKDTMSYRTAKFVQRHRLGVAAGVLVLLTLLGGVVATSWENRVARQEKAKAESISAFLEQIINYSNPYLNPSRQDGRATTLTEVLDQAAKRLGNGDFAGQPEVRAELERIIASSYYSQGRERLGNQHMQEYVLLQSKRYGPNHPKTVQASAARAMLLFGGGGMAESEKIYRHVLPLMRSEQGRGEITAEALSAVLSNFAYLRRTQGDSKEAESLFREVLALSPQMPRESRYLIGMTQSTLASTLADEGRFEEALQTAARAVTTERVTSQAGTPTFGFSLTILGGFLVDKKEFSAGDAALQEGEAIFRKLLSPSHLWLGDNLRNQAISFYEQGRLGEAQKKDAETRKIYLESFGSRYDNYPTALITQGLILSKLGKSAEGEVILRQAVKLRTESLPKDHFWVALANDALGECLTREGRSAEAEPLLAESYEILHARLGPADPRTKEAARRLADLYDQRHLPRYAAKYRELELVR